ncbi:hypothetical protein LCGC14_1019400 [marine sediment metagenome]|uniref:Uncharacterized protein n=1 Tax=marine sediment metagenome TaxID=412755 RepID=A0A0F9MXW2_9ZZZZ
MASMRENPSTEDGVTEPELDTRTEPFQVVEVGLDCRQRAGFQSVEAVLEVVGLVGEYALEVVEVVGEVIDGFHGARVPRGWGRGCGFGLRIRGRGRGK